MKIAFISHLDRNLYHFRLPIMKELIAQGHEVYVIVPYGSFSKLFKQYNIKVIHYNIERRSLNPFKEIKTIYNIYIAMKNIKVDILHSFTIKPNIYAVIAGKRLRIKNIICTVTGLGSYYIFNSFKAKVVRFIIEILYKLVFKYSSRVIFQNPDDLNLYVNNSILSTLKAKLIRSSGIDTELYNMMKIDAADIGALKNELAIKDDEIIILMISRAIMHKGALDYLKVSERFKYNKKIRFLYAGDIDKGNPSSLSEEAMNSCSVEWLKYRTDILNLIAVCDIFILPSYREGVPRTLLEAGSMSKPIVTTNAVGCREVVDENKNGFKVKAGDIDDLAKKINILVNDKELRKQFGLYSRNKIISEFDIKYVVEQYIALYNNVVENE